MKTWEMLRDIREGETYELVKNPECYVKRTRIGVVWESGANLLLTPSTFSYEWRKRQQLVDFATAFTAYERGETIRSEAVSTTYTRHSPFKDVFPVDQIRGKWIVEGSGEHRWE